MKTTTRLFILFIVIIVFLPSCATIALKNNYNIHFQSSAENAKLQVSNKIYHLPADVNVIRSKEDLKVTLLADTLQKDFVLKSGKNLSFMYGNLFLLLYAPVGYGVDLFSEKRFDYGYDIFLDPLSNDSVIRKATGPESLRYFFSNEYPTNKGQVNLLFSLPWVNSFYQQPKFEKPRFNTGFWGTSLGAEYFHKENRFIALTGGAVMDFFLPFPAAVDLYGEHELMSSLYVNLTHNHKAKRFTYGYGITYSKNRWAYSYTEEFDTPPPSRGTEPIIRTNHSVGLTLTGYLQFGKRYFMGLVYRPTFIQIHPDTKFHYEHLISLDLMWKFKVR